MDEARKCDGCLNDVIRLTGGAEGGAFYLCRAIIGETYFQDFKDLCLARAILAEAGLLRPDSCQQLVARWKLLGTAASAPDPPDTPDSFSNEGHRGDVWS